MRTTIRGGGPGRRLAEATATRPPPDCATVMSATDEDALHFQQPILVIGTRLPAIGSDARQTPGISAAPTCKH